MSLKAMFLAFKKSCTSCPNWGEGGREVIWTKSKRAAAFLREPLPYAKPYSSYLPPSAGGIGAQTNIANAEPCPSILIVPLPLPLFIYVSYILIFSF